MERWEACSHAILQVDAILQTFVGLDVCLSVADANVLFWMLITHREKRKEIMGSRKRNIV